MPGKFSEVLAGLARAAWPTIDQGWPLNGRPTQWAQPCVGTTPTRERPSAWIGCCSLGCWLTGCSSTLARAPRDGTRQAPHRVRKTEP